MRSLLEQAIIQHLNGDETKAHELFHQFIVARARQMHESMRNGEDPLAEGFDDTEVSEEYFNEGELDELDSLEDETSVDGDDDMGGDDVDAGAADDLGDDMGVDAGDDMGDDMGGDDDLGGDDMGDDVSLDSIADSIESLEAKLDELLADYDTGEDDDFGGNNAPEMEDDMSDTDPTTGEDDDMTMESEDDEDEDMFEGLGESITSELEKISVKMDPAGEVGAGPKVNQNGKSALPQKSGTARQGGSPIHIKQDQHKGFERETAPSSTMVKKRRNNSESSKTTQSPVASPVKKEGAQTDGKSRPVNKKAVQSPEAKGVQK